jgi:lipopolysaccharide export LptBFGC system permease protein LptF
MFRLPLTLWRAVAADLTKLVTLTAAVLVTVIAFAGAVKPLSDGVLAATDALRYILLAIPPMLAYAMPFAGGFASTLVYHRMAADLEATAAYAGGISHRRLLAPAVALALVCGSMVVVLNEEVIPRFLEQMQRLVTMDVARYMAQRIDQGDSVPFRGLMVHADRVQRVPPAPDSGVIDQLLLLGFAAMVHDNDVPTREVTARVAKLWLIPTDDEGGGDQGSTRVLVKLESVVGVIPDKGVFAAGEISDLSWTVPNAFRDNVKFRHWRDLAALRAHPEKMNWVENRRQNLAYTLAERRTLERLTEAARTKGRLALLDARGNAVDIACGLMVWDGARWVLLPGPGGVVEVRYTRVRPAGADGGETRIPTVVSAAGAALVHDPLSEAPSQRLVFRLDLTKARTVEAGAPGDAGNELPVFALGGLTLADSPAPALLALPIRELLPAAAAWLDRPEPDPVVKQAADDLRARLVRLDRDITAKRHERMALASTCLLVVLAGAVNALALSRRLPLTVYLWTFFPALMCLVCISGGQQAIVSRGDSGILLMWGGVTLLAGYVLFMYLRLRRH